MTIWYETDEAAAFIASGDSRETDKRIMAACAFFARSAAEAEANWQGDFAGRCDMVGIWEYATNNGMLDGYLMQWGDAGNLNDVAGTTQRQFLGG